MATNPEQPAYHPTPENTWLSAKNVFYALTLAVSLGGLLYQTKAMADDVADLKQQIVKKAESEEQKAMHKAMEERLQKLEQFVAVQTEINKKIEKLDEKLDKALSKKP